MEISVVEQRYLAVQAGATVVEAAARLGVSRQCVHSRGCSSNRGKVTTHRNTPVGRRHVYSQITVSPPAARRASGAKRKRAHSWDQRQRVQEVRNIVTTRYDLSDADGAADDGSTVRMQKAR